ncbi:unnamed protein product, partial [Effrenium voratum]
MWVAVLKRIFAQIEAEKSEGRFAQVGLALIQPDEAEAKDSPCKKLSDFTPLLASVFFTAAGDIFGTPGTEVLCPGDSGQVLCRRADDWWSGAPTWLLGGDVRRLKIFMEVDVTRSCVSFRLAKQDAPVVVAVPGLSAGPGGRQRSPSLRANVQGSWTWSVLLTAETGFTRSDFGSKTWSRSPRWRSWLLLALVARLAPCGLFVPAWRPGAAAASSACHAARGAAAAMLLLVSPGPAAAAGIENGQNIFLANCAACHAGGNNAVQPDKKLKKDALETYGMYDVERIKYQVTNGKNAMPAFGERLGPEDIADTLESREIDADKFLSKFTSGPCESWYDVLGGLWSGIKCVLSGVLVGLAGVIAQPIEGARDAGVLGCFRGVGIGLLVGAFFSITGLCTGVFQAVRGVAATPRAICMASRGWTWDAETGTWNEPKVYSLPEEAEEVLAGEDDEGEEEVPRRVVDSYYYDQLGVPSNASQQEIRRAYFQKSRQCHPDKTTEADAKERFQAVSEAYQVLSDPKRRRDYDSRGRSQQGFIDAKIFFSVLLGADALAPFIGRLRISEMFGQ